MSFSGSTNLTTLPSSSLQHSRVWPEVVLVVILYTSIHCPPYFSEMNYHLLSYIKTTEMGSRPKSLRSFHIHGKKHEFRDVPKGCLAIKVGQGEDDLKRFVVPLIYINHPLFFAALEDPS
ncbi:hypothetical protein K1719_044638 [Acacia pycnantha]|nr:hypothetical protein K1719_044638 [Acacia pycnantha]